MKRIIPCALVLMLTSSCSLPVQNIIICQAGEALAFIAEDIDDILQFNTAPRLTYAGVYYEGECPVDEVVCPVQTIENLWDVYFQKEQSPNGKPPVQRMIKYGILPAHWEAGQPVQPLKPGRKYTVEFSDSQYDWRGKFIAGQTYPQCSGLMPE